jgi:hypothetical protein
VSTSDLSSRLLAAIEETERLAAIAKSNTEGVWGPSTWAAAAASIALYDKSGKLAVGSVSHIEHHDPASVLRRCAADRRLVKRCADVLSAKGWEYDDTPDLTRRALEDLASAYGLSDHQEGEA